MSSQTSTLCLGLSPYNVAEKLEFSYRERIDPLLPNSSLRIEKLVSIYSWTSLCGDSITFSQANFDRLTNKVESLSNSRRRVYGFSTYAVDYLKFIGDDHSLEDFRRLTSEMRMSWFFGEADKCELAPTIIANRAIGSPLEQIEKLDIFVDVWNRELGMIRDVEAGLWDWYVFNDDLPAVIDGYQLLVKEAEGITDRLVRLALSNPRIESETRFIELCRTSMVRIDSAVWMIRDKQEKDAEIIMDNDSCDETLNLRELTYHLLHLERSEYHSIEEFLLSDNRREGLVKLVWLIVASYVPQYNHEEHPNKPMSIRTLAMQQGYGMPRSSYASGINYRYLIYRYGLDLMMPDRRAKSARSYY